MSDGLATKEDVPRYLYKYRTVNPYTERIFLERSIFFASPSSFNDPFDCRAFYSLDGTISQIDRTLGDTLVRAGVQAATEMLFAILGSYRHIEEEKLQKFNEKIHETFGIFCLSEKNDDILMWSHYSNSHQGICIEFDTTKLLPKHRARLFPVRYDSQYPTVSILGDFEDPMKVVLVKAKHWEYEAEWRGLSSPNNVVKLPSRALSGVILGCNISPKDESQVLDWISTRRPRPRVYRAARNLKEFKLDILAER